MDGIVTFSGGNLDGAFTNSVVLRLDNKVTNESTNGLVFAIVPSSGLFSGNVAPPAGGHSLPFKGALLQKQKSAGGFFTGSTQSGRVTLRAPGS